jgi:hypothetical protein
VHLPTTDGRELLINRYTEPEPELGLLLNKLKLELPAQSPPKITASVATAGAAASFNSSSNSTDSPAKLLTKLSGFLISCAIPAVSHVGRGFQALEILIRNTFHRNRR